MSDFRKQWNDTCKAAGLKPICLDTAARIMAIVYEFDREDITYCPKLLTDLEYIQDEYGIDGGKIPHSDFQKLFAKYAREIESNDCEPTEWAKKLMNENYNIKLWNMGIFTRKKEKIVTDYITEQVDGAEVFVVSWDAFERLYSDLDIMRRHRKAKAFLKEEDAETFKKSLYDSLILLQYAKDKEEAQFILQTKIEKQS